VSELSWFAAMADFGVCVVMCMLLHCSSHFARMR